MEMVLSALFMIWGTIMGGHPDATFEQLVQASLDAVKPVVQPAPNDANDAPEGTPDDAADEGAATEPPLTEEQIKAKQALEALKPQNKQDPEPDAPVVKGIYVTAWTTAVERLNTLLKLVDDTELNAMVIDVKDDTGNITFKHDNPELAWSTTKIIPDVHRLIDTLHEHDIYPIARIVVFKDNLLAHKHPEWSFLNPDGSVWSNGKANYVNPYNKEVWDYNIEVAKEAIKAGFKEIQFDYVRFPEGFETRADKLKYTTDDRTRDDVVAEFVKYAREQLNPLGVRMSVDIFGFTTNVKSASGIGQDYNKISVNVDVISPMIYPSHYGADWYGSKVPDAHPYETVFGAMTDGNEKLKEIPELKPIQRPWIQDFTATWIKGHIPYGKAEVEAQIKALKDTGIEEYMLWDPNNNYRGFTGK